MKSVIENYIVEQPEGVQVILNNIRERIIKEFPEVEEKFSWSMPLFYLNGNISWFANFQAHIGMYPEPATIMFFSDRLEGYKTTKGAIQFKKKEEIPYELIMEIIRYKVSENNKK